MFETPSKVETTRPQLLRRLLPVLVEGSRVLWRLRRVCSQILGRGKYSGVFNPLMRCFSNASSAHSRIPPNFTSVFMFMTCQFYLCIFSWLSNSFVVKIVTQYPKGNKIGKVNFSLHYLVCWLFEPRTLSVKFHQEYFKRVVCQRSMRYAEVERISLSPTRLPSEPLPALT